MTAPNSANCLAYYKLDETSGTTAGDSTPNENDGTITGATWTTGVINSGLDFGTSSQTRYVTITDKFNHIPTTAEFTLSLWWKPSDYDEEAFYYLMGNNTGGVFFHGWLLYYDNRASQSIRQRLRFVATKGSTPSVFEVDTGDAVSSSDWIHIVVTGDGTTVKMYLDAVEVDSGAVGTLSTGSSSYNTVIGVSPTNPSGSTFGRLAGLIDEVGIFDVYLTADEVSFLYAGGSPGEAQQYPFSVSPDGISKVNGIPIADIGKINGVTKANISKVSGVDL